MQAKGVFLREATGLIRTFSLTDFLLINILCCWGIWPLAWQFTWTWSLYPGADIVVALLIGFFIMAAFGLTYAFLSAAMPRSGGDYIYMSRAIHPAIGFAWNWQITWWMIWLTGWIAAVAVGQAIPAAFTVPGIMLKNQALIDSAAVLAQPMVNFAVAAVFIILMGVVIIMGIHTLRAFIYITLGLSFIGIAVYWGLMAVSTPETFSAGLYYWTGKTAADVINAAKDAGWTVPAYGATTLMSIPLVLWSYAGCNYSNYLGGEVKNGSRNNFLAVIIGLLMALVFWAVSAALTVNAFGYEFMQAMSWLSFVHPEAYPLPAPGMQNFLVSTLTTSPAIALLASLGYGANAVACAIPFLILAPRNMFAWSFDRIVPSSIASISDRFHTPVLAVAICTVGSIIMAAVYIFTQFFAFAGNYVLFLDLSYMMPCLAGALFPFTMREVFKNSPYNYKIGPIPVVTITGLIGFVLFGYMTYILYTIPVLSGPTGLPALAYGIGIIVLGFIIYYGAHVYYKSKGIDIGLAFKEVPPE